MENRMSAKPPRLKARLQAPRSPSRLAVEFRKVLTCVLSVLSPGLVSVILGVFLIPHVEAAEPSKPRPDIVGWYYSEEANVPIISLVKVWRDADGRLRGSTDNLARGETNHIATSVFYDAPNFRMESDWNDDLVKGTLSEDGSKLDLLYQAGDFNYSMILKRIDPSRYPPAPELSYLPTSDGAGAFAGYWNGSLELLGAKVRHVLRLGRKPDGSLLGRLDMIESGERGVPVTRLEVTGREARFECKPMELLYVGRLSEDGNRLEVKLERGTVNATTVFHRAAAPWVVEEPQPGIANPPLARALEGEWVGVVDRQSTFWRSGLRFGRDAEGQIRVRYRFSVDEPEGVPMLSTSVRFDGREFTAEWLGALWSFSKITLRGTLDEERQRITGFLDVDGSPSPTIFERPSKPVVRAAAGK